ncbi:MAG: hypothetical protein DYH17_15740 [Xanthomonadales bacterium PRO6]|nr:hypothetical protein [Xanthomonadales bacterium PRO6]
MERTVYIVRVGNHAAAIAADQPQIGIRVAAAGAGARGDHEIIVDADQRIGVEHRTAVRANQKLVLACRDKG